jgi:hypothetical protein
MIDDPPRPWRENVTKSLRPGSIDRSNFIDGANRALSGKGGAGSLPMHQGEITKKVCHRSAAMLGGTAGGGFTTP